MKLLSVQEDKSMRAILIELIRDRTGLGVKREKEGVSERVQNAAAILKKIPPQRIYQSMLRPQNGTMRF